MVSAYLRKGQLTFARRCRTGRAFEVYRKKFNNDHWHSVSRSTVTGGQNSTPSAAVQLLGLLPALLAEYAELGL